MNSKADIGIIGGSGFYQLFKNARSVLVKTPYGSPSDKITLGKIHNKKVAFLPRHGRKHQYPPHKIPYKANLYALKSLGVKWVISPSACGSLDPKIKPGDFVICDQFVDRTRGRDDTYFHGPKTVHVSSVKPYCPNMRQLVIKACQINNISVHKKGTVVVINGPRFSSKAESLWFQSQGWQVINMTQYPELILARELELCYLSISLITDYDAGSVGDKRFKPVSLEEVIKVFRHNNQEVIKVIKTIIKNLDKKRLCQCSQALQGAKV